MGKFHESKISKTQKVIGYALSILFSIQILTAGILKVIKEANIVERMNNIPNWGDKLLFVGALELILLAIYWVPKTQKLGFYLLCSYMGGVIVAEVAAGTHIEQGAPPAPLVGVFTTILLYAGTVLRKPTMLK
ncbi:MAG: DoxX family protein [Bacteroidota bacterium]